jgi:hypothetical protein
LSNLQCEFLERLLSGGLDLDHGSAELIHHLLKVWYFRFSTFIQGLRRLCGHLLVGVAANDKQGFPFARCQRRDICANRIQFARARVTS